MSERRNAAARLLLQQMKKSLNPSQDLAELALDATLHAVELERQNELLRKRMPPLAREQADRDIKKAKILSELAAVDDLWGAEKIVKGWTRLGGGE